MIAVDGGGSHCRVAVADESGVILERAISGSANIATNFTVARNNIMQAIQSAWQKAGLAQDQLCDAFCVMGLAGANVGDFGRQLTQSLLFKHIEVTDDRPTSVRGVLQGEDGCIAAVGTGTFYFSRIDSIETSIGGWGFMVGDDGGGARLGQNLLRRVIHCHDGFYPHSELTRRILADFNQSPTELVEFASQGDLKQLASLAKEVVEAARQTDSHGLALINETVNSIQMCIDQVGFIPQSPLYMVGGLGTVLLTFMQSKYANSAIQAQGDALSGALLMAQDLISDRVV